MTEVTLRLFYETRAQNSSDIPRCEIRVAKEEWIMGQEESIKVKKDLLRLLLHLKVLSFHTHSRINRRSIS